MPFAAPAAMRTHPAPERVGAQWRGGAGGRAAGTAPHEPAGSPPPSPRFLHQRWPPTSVPRLVPSRTSGDILPCARSPSICGAEGGGQGAGHHQVALERGARPQVGAWPALQHPQARFPPKARSSEQRRSKAGGSKGKDVTAVSGRAEACRHAAAAASCAVGGWAVSLGCMAGSPSTAAWPPDGSAP